MNLQNSGGMVMKKIMASALLIMMCALMLFGCGEGNTADTGNAALKDVALSTAMEKLNEEIFDKDSMKTVDSLDKLELYYDIAPADVAEFAAEIAKNSATEINEAVIIKATDADAAKRVAEKLELRLQSQKDLCASYSAELLAVAEKCEVRTKDVLVTLIVCDNYQKAISICDEVLFG
ncbi:MAG: DUF4358 domain-containing protein [Ruminococcaceae bacterium]|nr:DUF4358 domain-containing protein [Oscillospiraceae bacterium]